MSRVNAQHEDKYGESSEQKPGARAEFLYRRLKRRVLVVGTPDERGNLAELGSGARAADERGAKTLRHQCACKDHGFLVAEYRVFA